MSLSDAVGLTHPVMTERRQGFEMDLNYLLHEGGHAEGIETVSGIVADTTNSTKELDSESSFSTKALRIGQGECIDSSSCFEERQSSNFDGL